MKKSILFSTVFMFLLAFNANASDANVTVEQLPPQFPGEVIIPVNVDFSQVDVCAIDIFLVFDQDVLSDTEVINFALNGASLSVNTDPNGQFSLSIQWADLDGANNFQGKLFDLKFDYTGGYTDIEFFFETDPPDGNSYTETGDCVGGVVETSFVGAYIEEAAVQVPLALWGLVATAGLMLVFIGLRVHRVF